MNRVKNDKGEWVIASGASNSLARFECEYPAFIKEVGKYYDAFEVDKTCYPHFSAWFYFCCDLYGLDDFKVSLAEDYFCI